MKRIQYHRYGGPEELRLEDVEHPSPTEGEVLVRVVAASANPMDWAFRRGDAKLFTGSRFPRGLGHDFAGVVEAVGAGVDAFSAGDEVLGATAPRQAGAFAEAVTVKQKHVFRKPPGLSFEQAAALTITGMTAYTALIGKAKLRAGQSVFVTGCLGGVGRAGVQIALGRGARVTGSCSAAGREEALALGVEDAVDYRVFDPTAFRARFEVVFDAAGALSPGQCDVMLARGGVALHVTKPLSNMVRFLFSRRHHAVVARQDPETMAELIAAAEAGRLRAAIGRTVPLADAIPALVELEVNHQPKGKLLIKPARGGSWLDAENALSRFGHDRGNVASLADASSSAARAADKANLRYRGGTATLTDALDAERQRIGAESDLAQAKAMLTSDWVGLQASLGLGRAPLAPQLGGFR